VDGSPTYQVSIGERKYKYAKTLDDAKSLRSNYLTEKAEILKTKRARTLEEKRQDDLEIHGNDCKQERDVCNEIKTALKAAYPNRKVVVLNDQTRADVIFEVKEGSDSYKMIQVKTAHAKKYQQNTWEFKDVNGYHNILVVCWKCNDRKSWVFEGSTLVASNIGITPNGIHDRRAIGRSADDGHGLDIVQLVKFLGEYTASTVTTVEDARCDFRSEKAKKEYIGIQAFKKFRETNLCDPNINGLFAWPDEQGSHVDFTLGTTRVQMKTAQVLMGKSGFECPLYTKNGKDHSGRQLRAPYSSDSFDVVIATVCIDAKYHFWKFDASVLESKGLVKTPTQKGRKDFLVYFPSTVLRKRKNSWTRDHYIGFQ
jgi:hypothetical protein